MNTLSNIKKEVDLLILRITQQKAWALILSALGINIIITVIFSYLLFPNTLIPNHFDNKIEAFLVTVVAAPAIESYLLQVLIMGAIITKYNNKLLAVVVSALIFAAVHHYSIGYVIKGFFSGVIYAVVYLAIIQKKLNGFLYLWLLHGLFNLVAFIVNNYIDT